MKVFLECISTPTADTTGAAFVLHFDTKRYVFGNIHEGFQRSALQRGTKFTRISDLFLTGKTEWQSTGGTIGFLLTLADAVQSSQEALKDLTKKAQERTQKSGLPIKQIQSKEPEVPRLAIHGGPNITHTLATARRFIFRKGLPIDVFEHGPLDGNHALEPTWQDQFVRVWAMPIDPLRRSSYGATPPKRSFEEFLEQPESGPGDLAGAIQPPKEDDATKLSKLQGVIKDMFESNWRLDALFETPLRELKLPATIFERNLETKQLERYTERVAENPADRPDITVLVRKPWPGALVTRLPLTQPSSVSMSYLVRTHQQRGKFLPKKARELGVIPGDNYRKLAEGETITLGNGTVVSPEQVLEPPRPGSGFLIAEIPSVEYLDNFLSRPEFSESAIMDSLKAMVWLLGPGVGDNPRFQDFVRKHADTQHILASQDYNANRLVFESAAAATIRHAIIDPQRYDIPSFSNDAPALPEPLSHCRISESGLMVQFEPSFAIEMNANASLLNTKAVVSELPAKVREAAKAAQQEVQSETFTQQVSEQDIPGGDNEIITIGTGSAMPSKYRNVSATLLRVPGVGSYLLDCGENTLGQLARMYKPDDLRAILRDLKVIWISHLHADHHLGTTSVIKAWYKATADVSQPLSDAASRSPAGRLSQPGRLFIASDGGMIQWLKEYSEVEDIGRERLVLLDVMQAHDTTWVRWEDNEVGFASTDKEAAAAFASATGLSDFSVCYVPHCKGSQGVALTFADGFKITYSGDTRPAKALVDIGKDSTVLIHEATFEDERAGDARAKNHSTTSDAIGVGKRMNARRVLLTHFSQRYTKIPVMSDIKAQDIELVEDDGADEDPAAGMMGDDIQSKAQGADASGGAATASAIDARPSSSASIRQNGMKVAVAFDGMRVKVKDLIALEKFTPALMMLYEGANASAVIDDAQKAEKQVKHREQKLARKAELRAQKQQQTKTL